MKKFVIRRVLLGIVILFFVSLIIYSIERSLPTSYVKGKAMAMSQKQGAKPYEELLADLNASYGLDKPVLRKTSSQYCCLLPFPSVSSFPYSLHLHTSCSRSSHPE